MSDTEAEEDYHCSLCYEIYFYPVTLPCQHHFCKECFDKHCENNGFKCPYCRLRISNWLRKIKVNNANIVDEHLWKTVQKKFPNLVKQRKDEVSSEQSQQSQQESCEQTQPSTCTGNILQCTLRERMKRQAIMNLHAEANENMALDLSEAWSGWSTPIVTVCRDKVKQVTQLTSTQNLMTIKNNNRRRVNEAKPGEILQYFNECLQKEKEERQRLEENNLRLSEALIRMIENEEKQEAEERKKQIEEQLRADEELAKSLLEQDPPCPQSTEEMLQKLTTPKRRKFRKQKMSMSTVTLEDTSGYTDATNSSPFKNSQEFNNAIYDDNPVFLGPYKPNTSKEENIISLSSSSSALHCSTPKSNTSQASTTVNISPIPLDRPSTSKQDIFAKYRSRCNMDIRKSSQKNCPRECPITPSSSRAIDALSKPSTSSFSNQELSHFAPVVPGPSTSTSEPFLMFQETPMSRSSSGADSIGRELNYFKPIRSSPTTPPKEGSSSHLPKVVVAHKGGVGQAEVLATEVLQDFVHTCSSVISAQELEESIKKEKQIEEDRRLALEMEKEWNNENKRKRHVMPLRTDYNLRKRRKGNLRKKVLMDRTQTTLDSMLIK